MVILFFIVWGSTLHTYGFVSLMRLVGGFRRLGVSFVVPDSQEVMRQLRCGWKNWIVI